MARSQAGTGRRPFVTAFKLFLYAGLLGFVALAVAVAVAVASLPSYDQLTQRSDLGQMIRVHASNGAVLVSLGPSFGQWLTYDQIPASMRSAMIAIEDRRFRSHPGVDPIGIVRAVGSAVIGGHRVRATSTITQPLARNIFLSNNRSMGRKIKEAVLALALERKFSKDQILEL
jgi:penicillin-binding protein 1A